LFGQLVSWNKKKRLVVVDERRSREEVRRFVDECEARGEFCEIGSLALSMLRRHLE
jgi:hypothetical protein